MTSKLKCRDNKTKSFLEGEQKMIKILNKINNSKLSDNFVSKLTLFENRKRNKSKKSKNIVCYSIICGLFFFFGVYYFVDVFSGSSCYIEMPASPKAIFRPPLSCDACSSVRGIERVSNITAQEFESKYAYSMQPVIVTDATKYWKALDVTYVGNSPVLALGLEPVNCHYSHYCGSLLNGYMIMSMESLIKKEFNYNFFKNFYENNNMGTQTNECFFFPYKSGFDSLSEVFKMPESRANLSGEPWYVGWSTCYDQESRKLREYYTRPYFLPVNAESDVVDWMFMGGPGQGAHMHVDSVRHTSWQAQIQGAKRWELAPAPECLYTCHATSFVVHPGEILVVDTNRWYHRTSVQPGDISITIGAEYD